MLTPVTMVKEELSFCKVTVACPARFIMMRQRPGGSSQASPATRSQLGRDVRPGPPRTALPGRVKPRFRDLTRRDSDSDRGPRSILYIMFNTQKHLIFIPRGIMANLSRVIVPKRLSRTAIFSSIGFFGFLILFQISNLFSRKQSQPRRLFDNLLPAPICSTPVGFLGLAHCSMKLDQNFHLIRNPEMMPNQSVPVLHAGFVNPNLSPEFSLILPVYNQEGVVSRHLELVLNNTAGLWELIIILDGCFDGSLQEVITTVEKWYAQHQFNSFQARCANNRCELGCLTRFQLIVQSTSVDETTADNIGMRAADPRTSFFVLMQADLMISEPAWNIALSVPHRVWTDVFSVSARCGHNMIHGGRHVGLCGANVDAGYKAISRKMRQTFTVRQSNNRGPLMLNATRTIQLGFLDEVTYRRGDDDHDINMRAYFFGRWVAGHYPVRFRGPLKDGASRRSRDLLPAEARLKERLFREARTRRSEKTTGFLRLLQKAGPPWTKGETRAVPDEQLDRLLCPSNDQ